MLYRTLGVPALSVFVGPSAQSVLPHSRHVPLDAVVSRATEAMVSQLNEASKQNGTVGMKKATTEATLDLLTDFLWGKRLVEGLFWQQRFPTREFCKVVLKSRISFRVPFALTVDTHTPSKEQPLDTLSSKLD